MQKLRMGIVHVGGLNGRADEQNRKPCRPLLSLRRQELLTNGKGLLDPVRASDLRNDTSRRMLPNFARSDMS